MAPKVKTVKNSKLSKLLENCFEQVGKGRWPPISTWISHRGDKEADVQVNKEKLDKGESARAAGEMQQQQQGRGVGGQL
jgi:hypothetical protein